MIFDSLGWHNRAWSQKVGMTSYQLLYYMLELLLQTRQDFIIESNFNSSLDTARFSALQQRYPFRALQVLCSTDPPVLFERLRRRSRSPERHPGHGDSEDLAALTEKDIVGTAEPLALQGPTLVLDTTDFETIDYSHLVQEIQRYRARR